MADPNSAEHCRRAIVEWTYDQDTQEDLVDKLIAFVPVTGT